MREAQLPGGHHEYSSNCWTACDWGPRGVSEVAGSAWRSPGSAAVASPAGLAVGGEKKSETREPQDRVSEQK